MQNEQWIADRALLQRSLHDHPEWTQPQLAAALGRSLGFVKKWVKRLRQAPPRDMSVLFGLPRGRKTPYPQTDAQVEERILAIGDEPPENLKRVPGPKAILSSLPRDPALQARTAPLPRSTRTIWKILKRNDRIVHPTRRVHQPMERPAPMSCWQIDCKDASTVPADPKGSQQHVVEILNVVDMGTSIVVAAHVHAHFQAQTALEAMAEVLTEHGRPEAITFDRDPRLSSVAPVDAIFPQPSCARLLCLGIEPNVCPPQRPDLNAFVERYHRTLKQEWRLLHDPRSEEQVREANASFVQHYNQERPNQALACGNQPPRVVFAALPSLPHVPQVVDPDAWLQHVDGQHCIRKIRQNGTIVLDDVSYDVKQRLAGHSIDVSIDASHQELVIWHQHQPIKRLAIKGLQHTPMRFEPFVSAMAEQARSEQRRLQRARWYAQLGSESA